MRTRKATLLVVKRPLLAVVVTPTVFAVREGEDKRVSD